MFGPLLNLVYLNITDPAPAPALNWYNENATAPVGATEHVALQPYLHVGPRLLNVILNVV